MNYAPEYIRIKWSVRQIISSCPGAERQAYVNEQLGGNEAKANAYQDDIYYKPGRGGGRA